MELFLTPRLHPKLCTQERPLKCAFFICGSAADDGGIVDNGRAAAATNVGSGGGGHGRPVDGSIIIATVAGTDAVKVATGG